MKISFIGLLVVALVSSEPSPAQTAERTLVMETITKLFKGMQQGDSALVHSVFTRDVTLATVYRNEKGESVIEKETSISDFLKAVGSPQPAHLV